MQTTSTPMQTSGVTTEITDTPLLSHTVTATFTALPTSTLTPTPANAATTTPTLTLTATCTGTLTKPVVAYLSSGVQVSVIAPFELTPYVQSGKLVIPGLQVFVDGVAVENPTVYSVASNPHRIYVLLINGKPKQVVEIEIQQNDTVGLYCSGQITIPFQIEAIPLPPNENSNLSCHPGIPSYTQIVNVTPIPGGSCYDYYVYDDCGNLIQIWEDECGGDGGG